MVLGMHKKRIGIVLLLIFLLWRSANSVYVLAMDVTTEAPKGFNAIPHWQAGLTNDTSERIARALEMPPGRDVLMKRYELIRDKVPEHSDLFFLHEYSGTPAIYEILSYFRLSALLYPRNIQMVNQPPRPKPVILRNDEKGRYVLDLRKTKSALGEEFVKIDEGPDAILWQERRSAR